MNMTRRQFLQHCTISAVALGLRQTDLLKSNEASVYSPAWMLLRIRMVVRMDHRFSLQTVHGVEGSIPPQSRGLLILPAL